MRDVPLLTLLFAVLSLIFLVLLAFLRTPFPPYPLMSWQDVLDLLTPVVLIPVYWLLHSAAAYKALWQLITKPHYWEKTLHGLSHAAPTGLGADPASPAVAG